MASGTRIRANLQYGFTNAALTTGSTTIEFAAAPGFATLTAGQYIALTLGDDDVGHEIVHMTSYTSGSTTGTIQRGQEFTTARAFDFGVVWRHGPTAQDFTHSELSGLTGHTPSATGQPSGRILQTTGSGWQFITHNPATTVTNETTFGISPVVGLATNYARQDHTHGTPTNPVTAHEAAGDPHTGYQKESEKGSASGYASLDGSTLVPTGQLGSGTAESTVFLRGDQTWATPPLPPPSEGGGLYAETVGDGSTTVFDIAHGLDSEDVSVDVYDISGADWILLTPAQVQVEVEDVDTVELTFTSAPATDGARVVILGAGGSPLVRVTIHDDPPVSPTLHELWIDTSP